MSLLYLIIGLMAAATVISLVLSFLGILLVGALRLIPLVFAALLILVALGKARHGLGDDDRLGRR